VRELSDYDRASGVDFDCIPTDVDGEVTEGHLYAARHRAQLSAEEAACAAGVSVDTVGAVEVEKPVKPDVTAAMQGCALHCYAAELWCTRRL
jgi:DNA-binding XRE family transcriptional regulator